MKYSWLLFKYALYSGVLWASVLIFAPRLPPTQVSSHDFYQPVKDIDTPLKFLSDFYLYVRTIEKLSIDHAPSSYSQFSQIVGAVLEKKPRFPSLYLMLSNQLIYDYQKPFEAISLLKNAEALFPENKEIHQTLGYVSGRKDVP